MHVFMYYARTNVYFHIHIYPEPLKHYIIPYICTYVHMHDFRLEKRKEKEVLLYIPIKTRQRKTTQPHHHHHHQLTLTCILSELKKVLSILFRVLPNKCKSISRVPKRHKIVLVFFFFLDPKESADCCVDFDFRRLKTGYGESLLCDLWYLTGRNKTSQCCGRLGRWDVVTGGACRRRKKIN